LLSSISHCKRERSVPQTQSHKEQEGVTRADHYAREYGEIRAKTDLIRPYRKNKSIDAICNEIDADPDVRRMWYTVMEYFERIGVLFEFQTIDKNYVLRTLDAVIVDAWELTEPVVKELRKRDQDDVIFEHFERLYRASKDSAARKR
jgi:hypothetical protein